MNQSFKLIVVAQAEGQTPLYGYAAVWIELIDQNDNSPRFTQDHYMASVWEGNNKGTFVMQVSIENIFVWKIFQFSKFEFSKIGNFWLKRRLWFEKKISQNEINKYGLPIWLEK